MLARLFLGFAAVVGANVAACSGSTSGGPGAGTGGTTMVGTSAGSTGAGGSGAGAGGAGGAGYCEGYVPPFGGLSVCRTQADCPPNTGGICYSPDENVPTCGACVRVERQ